MEKQICQPTRKSCETLNQQMATIMAIMPPLRADRIKLYQLSFSSLKAFVNLTSQQVPLELGCTVKTMLVAVKQLKVLMP